MVATERVCRICGERLPLSAFHKDKHGTHGHSARCIECVRAVRTAPAYTERKRDYDAQRYVGERDQRSARSAAWHAANRDRHNEMNRLYWASHPEARKESDARRTARERGTQAEPVDYNAILERDDYECQICHEFIEPGQAYHFDHVIPLARGGTHTENNIQVAHADCNLRKGSKLP